MVRVGVELGPGDDLTMRNSIVQWLTHQEGEVWDEAINQISDS